jgi:hypothetical protein
MNSQKASDLKLSKQQSSVLEFLVWSQFLSMSQKCWLVHKLYQQFGFLIVHQSKQRLLLDMCNAKNYLL